ncbi:hypothetical protein DMC64_18595 [Amycolatopsis sp. WAC 04197]|uniref:hypothetical protein n=1 Tax=Amycolatopsis sp. WAC 04197 TaxID=2203199 RepID=UPI0010016680|nr:hypothetical protein [Amycolatopsis sp. WAC 04197]RSN44897.1 hypothetical protein DMC64_18595 [Amycolatopsis sp. WAC 04197]
MWAEVLIDRHRAALPDEWDGCDDLASRQVTVILTFAINRLARKDDIRPEHPRDLAPVSLPKLHLGRRPGNGRRRAR